MRQMKLREVVGQWFRSSENLYDGLLEVVEEYVIGESQYIWKESDEK